MQTTAIVRGPRQNAARLFPSQASIWEMFLYVEKGCLGLRLAPDRLAGLAKAQNAVGGALKTTLSSCSEMFVSKATLDPMARGEYVRLDEKRNLHRQVLERGREYGPKREANPCRRGRVCRAADKQRLPLQPTR